LTSHESGRTQRNEHRLPIIMPIAFADLNWTQHAHVELLAASVNFIVHDTNDLTKGRITDTLQSLLQSLQAFNIKVTIPASLKMASSPTSRATSPSKTSKEPSKKVDVRSQLAQVTSQLQALTVQVQSLTLSVPADTPVAAAGTAKGKQGPNGGGGEEKDTKHVIGKMYHGTSEANAQDYAYWDSMEFHLTYNARDGTVAGTLKTRELRKVVNGYAKVSDVPKSHALYSWANTLSEYTGTLNGKYDASINYLCMDSTWNEEGQWGNEKAYHLTVFQDRLIGVSQFLSAHHDPDKTFVQNLATGVHNLVRIA